MPPAVVDTSVEIYAAGGTTSIMPPAVIDTSVEIYAAGGIASVPAAAKSAGTMDFYGQGSGVVTAMTCAPDTEAIDSIIRARPLPVIN